MAISLLPLLLSTPANAAATNEEQLLTLKRRGFTIRPDPIARIIPGYEVWWNDQLLFRCLDWSSFYKDPSKITEPVAQLVDQTSHWTRNPRFFQSIISLFWNEAQQPPRLIAYTNLETAKTSIPLTFHSIESAVILVDSLGKATRTELLQSLTTKLFNGVPGKTPTNTTFKLAHVRENFFVFGCDVADGSNSHYEQLAEVHFKRPAPAGQSRSV